MEGRSYLSVDRKRRMRHAVEIRNASFVDPAFVELLRKYQVALVVADTAGKWPHHEDLTSDFVYIRLHGAEELYTSGYTDAALDEWRRRIESWNAGSQPDDARLISSKKPRRRASRQVYCYFDNDVKVRAPYDARQLLHRLGLDEHLQVSPGKLEGAID